MVTTLNFKSIIDLPKWRTLANGTNNGAFIFSSQSDGLVSDLRNNEDRHPFIFNINTLGFLAQYNTKTDEWMRLASQSLASNFTAAIIMPAQGPRGTLAAGATTTTVTLTTALPAAVGINQLANRGDGRGFKIRIIGNAAGSSGETEERIIVGNTSGTTPIITLDSALSFTPILGDSYEFLSGRLFMLGSTVAAGAWKYYDILTNSTSGNLSVVNLAINAYVNLVGLDELYVPYDRTPGEGFIGILIATASAAATLTGQAVGGDASVLANEHRNFHIRIVEDIAIPTAVGQRRNIISHTAGPNPVYTVTAWAVQPSATAKYVIENNGDRILSWTASTQTSTYTISTNTWDANVTFGARPGALGQGPMSAQSFSIEPDPAKNARHSYIYSFRGSNTNICDVLNISGAATGTWETDIVYGNKSVTIAFISSASTQDPATNEGRYMYIHQIATNQILRFDMKNRVLEPFTNFRIAQIGGWIQQSLAYTVFIDGNTKLSFLMMEQFSSTNRPVYEIAITR